MLSEFKTTRPLFLFVRRIKILRSRREILIDASNPDYYVRRIKIRLPIQEILIHVSNLFFDKLIFDNQHIKY